MSDAPPPVRRWVRPEPGEDWEALAARVFPERELEPAVADLQRWNSHVLLRPPTAPMTTSDILFVEPPGSGESA
ncbi:MAG: hypothetical protein J4G09_12110 [Proteobacteria bacterium]|nr:hypothetical protein [Pseudomonadota bacterium]